VIKRAVDVCDDAIRSTEKDMLEIGSENCRSPSLEYETKFNSLVQ
jgi:hypothetical protein